MNEKIGEVAVKKEEKACEGNIDRRGRLVFYHANGQGTGMALQFELRMNRKGEERYDCIFMEMARQKTASSGMGGQRVPATFDWGGKVTIKLDFFDVCEMLLVLEGKSEKMGGGRNGLYHEAKGSSVLITMERGTKQGGYYIGISKKKGAEQVFKGQILLSEAESLGLRHVLQNSLFFMVFRRNLREG